MTDFKNLEINGLKINTKKNYDSVNSIIIDFRGVIMSPQSDKVRAYLEDLNRRLIKNKISELICDFFNLELIDSDGFVEIVDWFILVNNSFEKSRIKISILYDREKKWQKHFLMTVKNLFPDLIDTEPV